MSSAGIDDFVNKYLVGWTGRTQSSLHRCPQASQVL